jgi:predicted enzyme related to lactoylglutathione lyase
LSTYLAQVVFDALDPHALAGFWREVLGWTTFIDEPDEVEIRGGADDVPIGFVPDDAPKRGKNRVHLDLRDVSVERCLDLGATHADIGQGDVPWTVLADPEGNEFCVQPAFRAAKDTGSVVAISLDAADVIAMRAFWREATGWVDDRADPPAFVSLRAPSGRGPFLAMGPKVAPKTGKNRIHIDVRPPADGDHRAEAERLVAAGARPVDIGQRDVPWVVLADPEDNELCVLTPRDDDRIGSSPTPDP